MFNEFEDEYMDALRRERKLKEINKEMYEVLQELEESVDYWSEYDVPIGIQDRIRNVLKKARGEV